MAVKLNVISTLCVHCMYSAYILNVSAVQFVSFRSFPCNIFRKFDWLRHFVFQNSRKRQKLFIRFFAYFDSFCFIWRVLTNRRSDNRSKGNFLWVYRTFLPHLNSVSIMCFSFVFRCSLNFLLENVHQFVVNFNMFVLSARRVLSSCYIIIMCLFRQNHISIELVRMAFLAGFGMC